MVVRGVRSWSYLLLARHGNVPFRARRRRQRRHGLGDSGHGLIGNARCGRYFAVL